MLDLMLDCCFLAKSANIKDLADEAEEVKILCRREDVRAGSDAASCPSAARLVR